MAFSYSDSWVVSCINGYLMLRYFSSGMWKGMSTASYHIVRNNLEAVFDIDPDSIIGKTNIPVKVKS